MRQTVGRSGRPATAAHARRLYDQAARLARFGAWECDLATQDLTWTDGVYDLFELPTNAMLCRARVLDLYTDESRAAMERMRAAAIRDGRGFVLDAEIRTWRGKARWMRLSAEVAREAGCAVRLFGAKRDITEERAAFERLRHMAERDSLTGLANRGCFDARYGALLEDPEPHTVAAALALVDVDDFKRINDAHGHGAGDECLRQTALRLRRIFGDALLVARIGGDEFAVLLRAPLGPARLRHMLERAVEAAGRPFVWDERLIDVGVSIGAATIDPSRPPAALFAEADAALYVAKSAGRRRAQLFGDPLETETSRPALRIA